MSPSVESVYILMYSVRGKEREGLDIFWSVALRPAREYFANTKTLIGTQKPLGKYTFQSVLSAAADMKIIYRNQCHQRLSISTQYTYNSGSYICLCQVKLTIRVIPLALELKPFIM